MSWSDQVTARIAGQAAAVRSIVRSRRTGRAIAIAGIVCILVMAFVTARVVERAQVAVAEAWNALDAARKAVEEMKVVTYEASWVRADNGLTHTVRVARKDGESLEAHQERFDVEVASALERYPKAT